MGFSSKKSTCFVLFGILRNWSNNCGQLVIEIGTNLQAGVASSSSSVCVGLVDGAAFLKTTLKADCEICEGATRE